MRRGRDGKGLDTFLSCSESSCKVKSAPPAQVAFHPDIASHQLHESRGDGQTEPSAAKLACGGTIYLGKSLENELLFFRGDTNTRVQDDEVQLDPSRRSGIDGCPETNFSALGELDGVANEVDDDLPQAARVANNPLRYLGADVAG